ncbi:MAG: NAD-dependent epimerase/dehydratase family protein [archaeon]
MKTVAVVGGAGFIGSHIADRFLLDENCRVVVIDNLSSGEKANVNPRATFVPLDIVRAEIGAIARALKGCSEIWHFAANVSIPRGEIDRFVDLRENVEGTVRLLEAAVSAGSKKFILASSSAVYGLGSAKRPRETAPCEPISMYGASKLAAEGYLSAYCDNFGISGTTFRIANVVGARLSCGLLYDILKKRGAGKVFLKGLGLEKKSYVHVSDCVEGMLRGAQAFVPGKNEIFNLGSDDKVSVKKVSEIVSRLAGITETGFLGGKTWVGDVPEMVLNCKKLKSLGWAPKLIKSSAALEAATRELLAE